MKPSIKIRLTLKSRWDIWPLAKRNLVLLEGHWLIHVNLPFSRLLIGRVNWELD